ncbi:hypothetical protein LOK49_LG10G01208 [Camellia lanceoleosa]|uniref:Uncharacterized protein n=1 Tax=Camellia lanceoleosa TaxID=1840588 RepID=A0ACC0G846_9ERIC|nr:hypothetical protein LOK49_LG10G01208 [Camellia lanceoleosa]
MCRHRRQSTHIAKSKIRLKTAFTNHEQESERSKPTQIRVADQKSIPKHNNLNLFHSGSQIDFKVSQKAAKLVRSWVTDDFKFRSRSPGSSSKVATFKPDAN